tara:strand:+ start:96 stop:443 length:348 start_codon:yes stop_codon:yes gene_type:complete
MIHDRLIIDLDNKLNNNQSSPNAISHKELNSFMSKAKKEILPIEESANFENIEDEKFSDLIKDWTKTSKNILLMMKKKEKISQNNANPKSLLALGAMGAHINMALQALKSTDFDV